jgi:hypothetical protein
VVLRYTPRFFRCSATRVPPSRKTGLGAGQAVASPLRVAQKLLHISATTFSRTLLRGDGARFQTARTRPLLGAFAFISRGRGTFDAQKQYCPFLAAATVPFPRCAAIHPPLSPSTSLDLARPRLAESQDLARSHSPSRSLLLPLPRAQPPCNRADRAKGPRGADLSGLSGAAFTFRFRIAERRKTRQLGVEPLSLGARGL